MHIGQNRFGQIDAEGQDYDADRIVFPEHVQARRCRQEGHRVALGDLATVLAERPAVLAVGTGYYGRMQVPEETLDGLRGARIDGGSRTRARRSRPSTDCSRLRCRASRPSISPAEALATCKSAGARWPSPRSSTDGWTPVTATSRSAAMMAASSWCATTSWRTAGSRNSDPATGQAWGWQSSRDPRGPAADAPHPRAQQPLVRATPKVGRNEPCPCGSGKKYKKCCGAPTSTLH